MKALKRFKDCELQVLVATDIAARGIDIESLPHVVNYDLPHVSEDYVHRIGRTGRAGESGQAVSLVSGEDRTLLRDIERLIGKQIEQQIVPGFEPGSGYHSAKPEPQGRRGQRSQGKSFSSPSGRGRERSERERAGRRAQPSAQPRQGNGQGNGQRRDRGQQRQGFRSEGALPSEKRQQNVQQQQLEHHRQQMAEENRRVAAPVREQGRGSKPVPALFGFVGRKVA
jgi:ATP-dependent RNA helicase RhlE